jgi:hypothetical protein
MKYFVVPIFHLIVNIILTFVFIFVCLLSCIADLIWSFKLIDETIEMLQIWTYLYRYNILKREWSKLLFEGINGGIS